MTVDSVLSTITDLFTDDNLRTSLLSILILCAGFFILAGLLRLIFGRRGTAVKAVFTTLDILILYCIVFVLQITVIEAVPYLPTLPFVSIKDGTVVFLSIMEANKLVICIELVNLIILAFLFGLTEDLLPDRKKLIPWLLLRLLSLLIVYVVFNLINWVFNTILPGFIITYAPVILLLLFSIFLAVTVFKWLIGLLLGITGGPVIGAIYTFFISSLVGRQLTKAALSSGIIMCLLYFTNHFGFTVLSIGSLPVAVLILVIAVPVAVRYFVSKLF